VVAGKFAISRQAVSRHLRSLVSRQLVVAEGETRSRQYTFAVLSQNAIWRPITEGVEEDVIWRQDVAPLLPGLASNVLDICRHGVTEIVNNVIDHSESKELGLSVRCTAADISFVVIDTGVGIFRKIKEACNLDDERHAILELAKGKLTTDPERHTGEGIFFTSRMCDRFAILSGHLYVGCSRDAGDRLLESREEVTRGTSVHLHVSPFSTHTTREVFDRYAVDQGDYAFNRTHVVVALAEKAQGEKLVSRSQAKRVMARLDRFKEVVLDFKGVDEIGPAFADEIFRIFQKEHPATRISVFNATEDVNRMILRATRSEAAAPRVQPETDGESSGPGAGTVEPKS
jgi:anti-sigma regulatory factor (Ser/Thr protein kinase)